MKESTIVLILVLVLLLLGAGVVYFSISSTKFNFYKAEISADGKTIAETLYFKPNHDYHTLFRNFFNTITAKNITLENSIQINNVKCSAGTAYLKESSECTLFSNEGKKLDLCPSYTENNEYGCTFGNDLGFKKEGNYFIQSAYDLHPENLFSIKGENYIKFIAYSSDRHVFLGENNFKTSSGIVRKNYYFPWEQVILYIPYSGSTDGFEVISKSSFEFDNSALRLILLLLFALFPSMVVFFGWFFFGRKNNYPSIPSEMSSYPNEREGWEVSCFFNTPFGSMGHNFLSTILISLYHKKVIDIQLRGKDLWIKINNTKEKLDKIENNFLNFLKDLYRLSNKKYLDGDYFYLKKVLQSLELNLYVTSFFSMISKDIQKEQRKYINKKGNMFVLLVSLIGFFCFIFINPFGMIFYIFIISFLIIFGFTSTLFVKFKGDYYNEYKHWQAFKKYLSHSFTISHGDHRAVAIWDHYLIYATALGVSKKVIKELRQANIIDEKHFAIYSGIYHSSFSFVNSAGSSGGGFGGAGAGGIGGGGGGGR